MSEKTVTVPNISCGHCVKTIELELSELEGVRKVQADVATKEVSVEWDDSVTDWKAVTEVMEEINFPPAG